MRRPEVFLSGWAKFDDDDDDRPVHRRRPRADARRDDPQPAAARLRARHRRGDHASARRAGRCASRSTAARRWSTRSTRSCARRSRRSPASRSGAGSSPGRSVPACSRPQRQGARRRAGHGVDGRVPDPLRRRTPATSTSRSSGPMDGADLARLDRRAARALRRDRVPLPRGRAVPRAQRAAHLIAVLRHQGRAPDAGRLRHLRESGGRDGAGAAIPSTAPTSSTWTSSRTRFDWNDHAQRRLNELLKDALDPNGILSPGKQGIWPRSMRA